MPSLEVKQLADGKWYVGWRQKELWFNSSIGFDTKELAEAERERLERST